MRTRWMAVMAIVALMGSACRPGVPPQWPTADGGGGAGDDAGDDAGEADAGTPDAGAPEWAGDLQWGTTANDEFIDLAVGADGRLFAVGYAGALDAPSNIPPTGDARAVAVEFSAAGEEVRSWSLDTSGTDVFEAVLVEPHGLTLAGRTTGAVPGGVHLGQYDALLAVAPFEAGAAVTALQFGDERPQHPRRLLRATDGTLAVAGYDDQFVPTNYLERAEEPTLAFATGKGSAESPFTVSSSHRFATEVIDYGFGLALAADGSGDIFMTGLTAAGPRRGPFVRRVSRGGTVIWDAVLAPVGFDTAADARVLADGTVAVVGSSFAQFGERQYGQQDVFVAWLDPATGALLRSNQAGSPESDWAVYMAIDHRGHLYAAGYTLGAFEGESAGQVDAFVVEFDAEGQWVGTWQGGSAGWDEVLAIAIDERGRVFVAGNTDGELVPGQARGSRDAFLLQIELTPREPSAGSRAH